MHEYPSNWKSLNTALCHDWLIGMRGGERVLEILADGFPQAPIYSLMHDPSAISATINAHQVHTSWLQSFPGVTRYYRRLLPLFPAMVRSLPLPDAELVISTSHCVAKSVRTRPETRHMCYCFTPMRYAWTFYEEYFGRNPLVAVTAKPLLAWLRWWDRSTASRVTRFVAISEHVRKRIAKFYGREADVVYPPVDTERCTPSPGRSSHDGYDLIVSALVPYKRVDLAVDAYTRLGYPLKVVGNGTGLDSLRESAGPNVEFLEWLQDDQVTEMYRRCRLLIFPGEEDFGIVPLEAQACGKPVVAYGKGGALETVREDLTGVFFPGQTVESLLVAIEKAADVKWDADAIRAHAETFSIPSFIRSFGRSVERCLAMAAE